MKPRFVPTNILDHIVHEDIGLEIYVYERKEKPVGKIVLIYKGRSSKPYEHVLLDDDFKRVQHINSCIENFYSAEASKKEANIQKKIKNDTKFKDVKVGDVFHEGGGYDQTNCHFYQLISLKGKIGTFVPIGYTVVPGSSGFMSERRIPKLENFAGRTFSARITGDSFKASYCNYAYKVSPDQSFYCSWYA